MTCPEVASEGVVVVIVETGCYFFTLILHLSMTHQEMKNTADEGARMARNGND